MLKKLLLTGIGLMLLVLPLGCVLSEALIDADDALAEIGAPSNESEETNDLTTPLEEEDLAMPDDFLNGFYIIVWETHSFGPSLDTKNNKIGVDTFKGYVSADYCMPREKLQEIYDFITQYDVKSYNGLGLITREDIWITTVLYHVVVFCLDGEVYSIRFDSTIAAHSRDLPEQYHNLRAFSDLIGRVCFGIEEYKSLPPGKVYF